jgi:HSP20 family molecular chaperone IbpA
MSAGPVVAIFEHGEQARRVVVTLRAAGFRGDQVGLAVDHGPVVVAAHALATARVAERGLLAALRAMEVPEAEARRAEQAFGTGRTVVTVTAPGRAREASAILRRGGGRR